MQTAVEPREAPARQGSVVITLPDGSTRRFDHPPTGREVALAIGRRLAEAAVAVEVDGEVRDLDRPIERDARVRILRAEDPEALPLLRHDCAHVMAQAVQELFPGTQVTIGPPIETGFYYDFWREQPFSSEDLAKIEARMAEIVRADVPFRREEVSREEARRRFEALGERFKLELLDAIPEGEPVTIYHQDGWFDLCRGPHGPSTGRIGAFKLLKVAGAYWRGDHRNPQLQRIYGTAFPNRAALEAYLRQLEEAEKRDHRRLGREMDLFHVQEEAPGSVFWHPRGWVLWRQVEDYVRRRLAGAGYVEVRTPQLVDRSLWERS
ncbi:MAG: TGS domain-containing protein, partial [Geminicoccaceae bacterium]|nr:TGS domain-containing protein [Geminicoccaceae bacterium]